MNELLSIFSDLYRNSTLLAGVTGIVILLIQWSVVRRMLRAEKYTRSLAESIERVDKDFSALCSASKGAGTQMMQVGKEIHRLTARQEQLELRGGGERAYQQAITLVQRGASADDLVKQCGIARGEADLVVMLHGMAKAS